MKTILTSQVNAKPSKIKRTSPDGLPLTVWREYLCKFSQKPSAGQFSYKQRLFRKFIKKFLLSKRNGNTFDFRAFWTQDAKKPLVYHVKVIIWKKNAPPGPVTTTPQPPPPAPGAL
jgi:hypothetical protein